MAIITLKDGRIVRTGLSYTVFKLEVLAFHRGRCVACGAILGTIIAGNWRSITAWHLHHKFGRKRRDDVLRKCEPRCVGCHRKKHEGAITMPCQVAGQDARECGAKASDCCIVCLKTLCADPAHQLRCKACNDPVCPGCRESHEAGCKG